MESEHVIFDIISFFNGIIYIFLCFYKVPSLNRATENLFDNSYSVILTECLLKKTERFLIFSSIFIGITRLDESF